MRKYHVDWLRNLAILFLFPYHTARVFDDYSPFYVKGATNSFSTAIIHIAYWFMPLLFLLAGMSSHYALQKRSARAYAEERMTRLFIPFVFGCLFIVPPQSFFAERFHRDYHGDYLEYLWRYFTDFSQWSEYAGGLTPAHLWFIAFLVVISLGLLPLMRAIVTRRYSPTWLQHPLALLTPFAGLAALAMLPDIAGKNIFVFAGYFLLGFLIATNDTITDTIAKHRLSYLAVTVVGTVGILAESFTIGRQEGVTDTIWHHLVHWAALLAILGYGKRYLDRKSRAMDYFTPAAFPVYIVHQTFLIIIGYHILQLTDSGAIAYPLIMLSTFIASLATYELIRRIRPLRPLLGLGPVRAATSPRDAARSGRDA